jgi:trimeric autotransporter adhesin
LLETALVRPADFHVFMFANWESILSRALALFLALVFLSFLVGCSTSPNSNQQQTSNPAPTIVSVSPSSVTAGASTQTLTITGTGFISSSVASFNSTALQTSYTSSTSLQATVPASSLASGQLVSLVVTNPSPGGGNSSVVNFSVTAPTAQITGIAPNYVLQSSAAVLLVTGTGFEANSSVLWNGSPRTTNFLNPTSLQVSISSADAQAIGSAQVTVNNPGPGGSTTSAASVVVYPAPSISSLTPATALAGSTSLQLTVTGANFVPSSVVLVDGVSVLTTYVSATTLQASVTAAALATGRTANVTVHNPAPTVADSAPASLPITTPVPTLSVLTPASVVSGQAATITLTGTGFVSNSNALWNGSVRPTTYVSATSLKVALTATDLAAGSTGQITVNNSAPGGGTSAAQTLTIVTPPAIASLSPSTIQVSSSTTSTATLAINGSNFASNAFATLNGIKLTATSQTASEIVATIPGSVIYSSGGDKVVVYNPGTGSLAFPSPAATLNVINPAASFTVTPSSAPAGSPTTTITINVPSGFFADSVVQWNGTPLATTYNGTSSLTAVVPAALLTTIGTAVISINTPENLGQSTPTQSFTTYVGLPVNDIAWNPVDGLIYATVPSSAGQGVGNSLVGIDPNTGTIQKTIFVGSEPTRLALSTDGTQAFVGLNGAGAVRQVNIATATAGVQFSLGGGPGIYNPPYTASSLASVPGQPNSVAVYSTNGIVTIYDSGVARPNSSSGLQTYFTSNYGGLSFGSSAATLYVSSEAIGSYVYALTVDATGITAVKSLPTAGSGSTLQYDNGRLYFPNGTVADAVTGNSLGQFSVPQSYSTSPVAASGPVVSDSSLNRAWVVLSSIGITAYEETTFNSVATLPVGSGNGSLSSPADLIRWGQNGLAFHSGNQLYILQGPIVKDNSSIPVDLQVTVQAPATAATGTSFATQFQVANLGPNSAQGVTLSVALPTSVIYGSVSSSQGSCSGNGTIYCDLGTLANGTTATVTLNGVPSTSGSIQVTGIANTQSFDSNTANNQATASTTVTGSLYSPLPVISSLSPNTAAAGAATFTLTVTGSGFTLASTVNWNGSALPTTFVSGSSLTAMIDASLVKQLGWGAVTVSSAAPGGGTSNPLTLSVYSLISVPANAMVYDPFTRKLWAVLPSTSTSPAGNSIVSIDPTSGMVGTPILIGSEPNVLAETSSGNYIYIGLSGAKSLGRFNMLTQSLDLTVPLATTGTFGGPIAANEVATIPGVDTSVAVPNLGILDFSGSSSTLRPNSALGYSDTVFTDSGHAYAFDNQSSGAEFYRYTVDTNGVHQVDGTTLLGMGGFSGSFAIDSGVGYGGAGGIFNPFTTPPSQLAILPLGNGPYGTGLIGGGVIPYTAENKTFVIGANTAGTWLVFVERFDTQHFIYEDQIQFPTTAIVESVPGTRWSQDGLAYILSGGIGSSAPSQIMLLRGPFVLPAEASSNNAPTLISVGTAPVTVGSGNQRITVTGSSFLPGATVLWNGVVHDTTYVNSQTLTVAVGGAEVNVAATVTVTCRNPGSVDSNAITVSIQ